MYEIIFKPVRGKNLWDIFAMTMSKFKATFWV